MQSLNSPQKNPLPIGGLPVNCCGPAGSPGPLGSIATLSAFNHHKVKKKLISLSNPSIYIKLWLWLWLCSIRCVAHTIK